MEDGQIGNAGDKLAIVWSEHGGPEVKPPRHQGFGSRLIKERWKDTARRGSTSTRQGSPASFSSISITGSIRCAPVRKADFNGVPRTRSYLSTKEEPTMGLILLWLLGWLAKRPADNSSEREE
jgi:hypothetical protein